MFNHRYSIYCKVQQKDGSRTPFNQYDITSNALEETIADMVQTMRNRGMNPKTFKIVRFTYINQIAWDEKVVFNWINPEY